MPALGAHFGVEQLRAINDFTALALRAAGNADWLTIGRVNAGSDDTLNTVPFATNALLGPSTGVSVFGLVLGNHGVQVQNQRQIDDW